MVFVTGAPCFEVF